MFGRKKKAKIDDKGYVTFLNDEDGLSSKDYLLILSTGVFFLFVSIGLIMLLFNRELSDMYLQLLDICTPAVITVVGGTMGVQAVESFNNRKKKDEITDEGDDIV